MPGRIVQLLVAAGATVSRGQPLLVLEAMKMEHTVKAPADGLVRGLRYAAGDLVADGAELCAYEPAARSDERRVGKEWDRACRYGWVPGHTKRKTRTQYNPL